MARKIKILIVRYGTIGDTIFTLPMLRELRNFYGKNAQIDYIAEKNVHFILDTDNNVDKILDFENFKIKYFWKIIPNIKLLKNYDKIYIIRKSKTLSTLSWLANVKERVGFNIPGNRFLTNIIKYNSKRHVVDLYADFLRNENIPIDNLDYDDIFAKYPNYDLQVDKSKKNIAINPFSRDIIKDWKFSYWCEVLKTLNDTNKYNVFVLGGKKDYSKCEKLAKNLKNIYIYAGKTSLQDSISILKQSDLFIGNDSGLMHIAATMKKTSILIAGPTPMQHWKPLNENCVIINKNFECAPCCFNIDKKKSCKCSYPKCLYAIKPKEIIDKITLVMSK